jgi:hypothetical protein
MKARRQDLETFSGMLQHRKRRGAEGLRDHEEGSSFHLRAAMEPEVEEAARRRGLRRVMDERGKIVSVGVWEL